MRTARSNPSLVSLKLKLESIVHHNRITGMSKPSWAQVWQKKCYYSSDKRKYNSWLHMFPSNLRLLASQLSSYSDGLSMTKSACNSNKWVQLLRYIMVKSCSQGLALWPREPGLGYISWLYHCYIMALGLCIADTAHSKQLAKHGACMRALDVLTLTEDMKQRYDKIVGDYSAKITDDQLREIETPTPTTNRESYVTLLSRFTQLNQVLYRTLPVKVFLNKVNTFRSCAPFLMNILKDHASNIHWLTLPTDESSCKSTTDQD